METNKTRLKKLNEYCDTLEARLENTNRVIEDGLKDNNKLKGEVAKLKKLVREQTSADLLVNGLKAAGVIQDEPHPLVHYQGEQNHLYGMQNQAGMAQSPGMLGALGGLGPSRGIF